MIGLVGNTILEVTAADQSIRSSTRQETPPLDTLYKVVTRRGSMATLAMKVEKLDLADRSHGEQIGERDVCVRINAMLETGRVRVWTSIC